LGVITLKPEATSMLSLFCVLLVVAQPAVNANRAMTLIMLNEVRICFIFIGSIQVWFDFVVTNQPKALPTISPHPYAWMQCFSPSRALLLHICHAFVARLSLCEMLRHASGESDRSSATPLRVILMLDFILRTLSVDSRDAHLSRRTVPPKVQPQKCAIPLNFDIRL
jgi:hypothetical protein